MDPPPRNADMQRSIIYKHKDIIEKKEKLTATIAVFENHSLRF
jgi:hypothetical protein